MTSENASAVVFDRLRKILEPYVGSLRVAADTDSDFSLYTPATQLHPKGLFFGAVQVKKSYVSYHLMPVYIHPELLEEISAALRGRMQGKSCFNFKTVQEELMVELEALTGRGYESFQADGAVPVQTSVRE